MKDNSNFIITIVLITWLIIGVNTYIALNTDHKLNQHIEESEKIIEHPSLEEMIGPNHQIYITIKTENVNDTCTIQKNE